MSALLGSSPLMLPFSLLLVLLGAQEAPPPPSMAPEIPDLYRVEPGPLTPTFEATGRIESANPTKVRVQLEEYSGSLQVKEVKKRHGRVGRGEAILILESPGFYRALRAAREHLASERLKLEQLQAEEKIDRESDVTKLAQAERANHRAEQELEIFLKIQGPKMLEASHLVVRGRENNVADQAEELAQLEAIYEGTRLASETKEIVLERARRNVANAKRWLEISRNDDLEIKDYRHRQRREDVEEALRVKTEALGHTKEKIGIDRARRANKILSAEHAVRDAEEKVARLQADSRHLTVSSPTEGLLEDYDLQAGDTVQARQVISRVLDLGKLVVQLSLNAQDLHLMAPEMRVDLSFPALAEISLTGRVSDISMLGQPHEDETRFPTTVAVAGAHRLLRIGLRCRVSAEGQSMQEVLAVPLRAVSHRESRSFLNCWMDGKRVEREVVLGARSRDQVQIISGLQAGDQVILPKGK